jgi:beta-1,4-mannosyltransferase
MQYHAMSLASQDPGARVSLVGYRGEACVPPVETHPRIHQYFVDPIAGKGLRYARKSPQSLRREVRPMQAACGTVCRGKSFLIFAAVKIAALVLQLLWILVFRIPAPDFILVQNPPSIPALAVVWLACVLRGSTMVIDWHNLGFSVLGMSLGPRHPFVKVRGPASKSCEDHPLLRELTHPGCMSWRSLTDEGCFCCVPAVEIL